MKLKRTDQLFESVLNNRIGQPFASDGNEYVTLGSSYAMPLDEVFL
jgi:hypothetical protein